MFNIHIVVMNIMSETVQRIKGELKKAISQRRHSTDKELSPQDEEKLTKMRKAIGSVRR